MCGPGAPMRPPACRLIGRPVFTTVTTLHAGDRAEFRGRTVVGRLGRAPGLHPAITSTRPARRLFRYSVQPGPTCDGFYANGGRRIYALNSEVPSPPVPSRPSGARELSSARPLPAAYWHRPLFSSGLTATTRHGDLWRSCMNPTSNRDQRPRHIYERFGRKTGRAARSHRGIRDSSSARRGKPLPFASSARLTAIPARCLASPCFT